jgi:hypothetical protein
MEGVLGIEGGEDEPWRPQGLLLFLVPADLGLFCLLLGGRLLYLRSSRRGKNAVTLAVSRCYTGILALLLALLAVAVPVLAAGTLGRGKAGEGPAVAREAPVYRIPDAGGAVEALLDEGRRVMVRAVSGSWVYVESAGGASGWARREAVISY